VGSALLEGSIIFDKKFRNKHDGRW
jgi:hypothetical protein